VLRSVAVRNTEPEPAVTEQFKRQAAEHAVEFVYSGMVVGLGTGSTALYATLRLAHLLREGTLHDVVAVPTSEGTATAAERMGIPLLANDLPREIDITIDGADEVSSELDLIKGGGGAMLREKIVAEASHRRVTVVDGSKLSAMLGARRVVPVEVVRFGWRQQADYLRSLGAEVAMRLRVDEAPFVTDQGNLILDCAFGPISDPAGLAVRIRARAGVVEHGLFIGLTSDLIVADADGLRHLVPPVS
jgi:ribose 5-phosphate isomerase A